jgi:hypothetical protein
MQIVRVYTGADGESHFEDLTPEQFAQIVNNVGEGPITLNCRPSPSFSDYHQAPRRQYVVICQDSRNLRQLTGASAGSPPATCWWPKT